MEYFIFNDKKWKAVDYRIFFKFSGSCFSVEDVRSCYFCKNNKHGLSYFYENKNDIRFEYCWIGKKLL